MADEKNQSANAVDFDAVADALAKLAEKPNVAALTVKQQLREPKVYDGIKKARAAGYKAAQIVGVLNAQGIKTTEDTFKQYWREIEREDAGEQKAKPDAKAKTSKPRAASATSEKPADTSSGTEGKTLTKKPSMGGAFNSSDL
jgi:hypothetical protein